MKTIKLALLCSILSIVSCENRDLDNLRELNKIESISFHENLAALVEKGFSNPDAFLNELAVIKEDLCYNQRCMFVNIKVHLKENIEPIEVQIGDDNLKQFAVTHRDTVVKNNIHLLIMHGLIYDNESSLPSKGSQVRGTISDFENSEIKGVETISIIEFSRN